MKESTGLDNVAIGTTESGGEMMLNVLNGSFDLALGELIEIESQLEAGEIKLLAAFTDERIEKYPDLPTVAEFRNRSRDREVPRPRLAARTRARGDLGLGR